MIIYTIYVQHNIQYIQCSLLYYSMIYYWHAHACILECIYAHDYAYAIEGKYTSTLRISQFAISNVLVSTVANDSVRKLRKY